MRILVTGTAGFIGSYMAKALLERGDEVIGIDNINDYYDVGLKYARLAEMGIDVPEMTYAKPADSHKYGQYTFIKLDICDTLAMQSLFETYEFEAVCHLAAQAGVRYSLTDPDAYIDSNIKGFLNVLECCRYNRIRHLLYASSSSVYGLNKEMPFSTDQHTDFPVSLYAASKKSNELMAHAYSHLFRIPSTALRFFTVYGPWGRPDMALFLFTKAITEGKAIQVFNNGQMKRDFTYIDDIISRMLFILDRPLTGTSLVPHRIFNIGRGAPVSLTHFIQEIEKNLGTAAKREYLPMQDGDVPDTWADIEALEALCPGQSWISVEDGVRNFVTWYKEFYKKDSGQVAFSAALKI